MYLNKDRNCKKEINLKKKAAATVSGHQTDCVCTFWTNNASALSPLLIAGINCTRRQGLVLLQVYSPSLHWYQALRQGVQRRCVTVTDSPLSLSAW